MSLSKQQFSSLIKDFKFREIFNELGWDNDRSKQPIIVEDTTWHLDAVASKSAFKVLICTAENEEIPAKQIRRKIQKNVAKLFFEHLIIYCNHNRNKQIWQTAIRLPNKPIKIHEVEWNNNQDPELLYQRASGLFFTFEEEGVITIVDVLKRIQDNFNTNSEKITKKFYERFKKEHGVFYSFIEGIGNESDQRWYASLMLNRLMFIYFIQKKGFLNNDQNYLKTKIHQVRESRGSNKFYKSFYKVFLCRLFHEGLGKPHKSDSELIKLIGKVPYLNGGLFDLHELEKDNDELDVKDEAFIRLFDFFDKYNWHLDDRITASGKDINPDVIGYIFEKYINDRAQMGAYYTKEDITEYISKNCIIPFLFDRTKEHCANAFLPGSGLWEMLKQDPDRYIYDAVKYGIDFDSGIKYGLPDDVIAGIDASDAELVEKRKIWNRPAPAEIALPTEIYREVIERRKRYFDIREKIEKGKIYEINDFITYNLNIRQFAQDAIENYEGSDFIESFFAAIAGRKYDEKNSAKEPTMGITILDPTCGSGAFLFAALNVLEPLYEGCIKRMREFVEIDDTHKAKKFRQFRLVLKEIENHPSEAYYILKSIILNNLYGVDIMKEAVETAKLRLFLKLVAQTDDIDHVEPLPDIDFNIRCGNTLIGLTKEIEIHGANSGTLDFDNFTEKIKEQCDIVAHAYQRYKQIQLSPNPEEPSHIPRSSNFCDFVKAKEDLNIRLHQLNDKLNILLFKQYEGIEYNKWLTSFQPFHWFAEFYEIVHVRKGFDVIIGNPPYLELNQINYKPESLKTFTTGAVHSMCIERSLELLNKVGNLSMIVPLAIVCTQRMTMVQKLLESERNTWYANFAWRPGKLFENVNRALTIFISNASTRKEVFITKYQKWHSETRESLFPLLNFIGGNKIRTSFWVPKLGDNIERDILGKILQSNNCVSFLLGKNSKNRIYYRTTGGLYWKIFTNFPPKFFLNGKNGKSSRETYFTVREKNHDIICVALLSSNTFWWWYTVTSNLRDLNPIDIQGFKFSSEILLDKGLLELGEEYLTDIKHNSFMLTRIQKQTGETQTQSFKIASSKSIIDEIDIALSKHFGFTSEELDFIINYDIKYRMGKELDNAEEEE
jgi:hypothetical protein